MRESERGRGASPRKNKNRWEVRCGVLGIRMMPIMRSMNKITALLVDKLWSLECLRDEGRTVRVVIVV
jgi:hypothetical protein